MPAEIKISIDGDARGLQSAANMAVNGLGKLEVKSKQAAATVLNFSRIVQDAPYAFRNFGSIANNIDPLVDTFTRLKDEAKQLSAETGKNVTVFSLLKKSLAGGAGIGLAISTVTSLISAFSMGMFSSSKATKKASEELDEYQKMVQGVTSELAKDASKVTTLFNALNSGELNFRQRQKALEQLKAVNVEFFGSLREENGIIVGLQQAYDGYLERLNDIGRAKAIEAQLTRLFDKKLQLELEIDPKFGAATDPTIQKRIAALKKDLAAAGGEVDFKTITGNTQLNDALSKRIAIQKEINRLQQGFAFFQDKNYLAAVRQIEQIDLQIKGLSELQETTKNFDIGEAATKKITEDFDLNKLFRKLLIDANDGFNKLGQEFYDGAKKAGEEAKKGFDDGYNGRLNQESSDTKDLELQFQALTRARELGIKKLPNIEGLQTSAGTLLINGAIEKAEKLGETMKGLANIATSVLAPAFQSAFDSIFSGSQNAFQAFGQAIGEIIKKLAAAAATALIFSAIIAATTSGASAAGTTFGTRFLGQFKSMFSQLAGLPKFATGVTNFRGGMALVGERGPEIVNLPRGANVIPNNMLGGLGEIRLEAFISNRGIYLSNKRGAESAGRLG